MRTFPESHQPAKDDTRTWGEHARLQRKEEKPALLESGDKVELLEDETSENIGWVLGERTGETDDELTPYKNEEEA